MSPSSTMLGPLDLAVPGEGEIVTSVRGMDAGVAKLLPDISNLKQSNYRSDSMQNVDLRESVQISRPSSPHDAEQFGRRQLDSHGGHSTGSL